MFYASGLHSLSNSLQTDADAIAASGEARQAVTATELMRHDVDRLLMITEALWTLMKKEHGYSDEDLSKLITEIDMRDGRLDGKSAQPSTTTTCPNCGKINTNKRPFCIYCGKPLSTVTFAQ